jgi:hypothetical protein
MDNLFPLRLLRMPTRCTCMTKPPDPFVHAEDCPVRVVWEAGKYITDLQGLLRTAQVFVIDDGDDGSSVIRAIDAALGAKQEGAT